LPWSVLNGEHIGRDFIHPYGPLSVYLNSGLMAVLGVSARTLVGANLAFFCGIAVCLFVVSRRSFGFLPAAVGTLMAIPVFGFGHYWGINNYSYAAPYSHEATHGMLLLLVLLAWLGRPQAGGLTHCCGPARWRQGVNDLPSQRTGGSGSTLELGTESNRGIEWGRLVRDGSVTGALVGMCWLTKTEYVLASSVVTLLAWARVCLTGGKRSGAAAWLAGVLLGGLAVLALTIAALAQAMPGVEAIEVSFNAILAPFALAEYSRSAHVLRFLGADNWRHNLQTMATWGGGTLACLAALSLAARWVSATSKRWVTWLFVALTLVAVLAAISKIPWVFCGTVLPALLAAAAVAIVVTELRRNTPSRRLSSRRWNQVYLFAAGVAMLSRMALDPTISHYGFFQALLASTWTCGFLIGEWPALVAPAKPVRLGLVLAVVVLLAGGTVSLTRTSLQFYRAKQTPIGAGADRIFGYSPSTYALPEMVELARAYIAANTPEGSSLLVIPEGISLNYWTRRRHPLRIIDLLPATLKLNRRDVVAELAERPPDTVVLITRPNMEEFGVKRYGQDEASGKAILDWVSRNYTLAAQDGGDPFAPGEVGVRIYRRAR